MGASNSKESALHCITMKNDFNLIMDQIDDAHAINQKLAEIVKLNNLPIILAQDQLETYTEESIDAFKKRENTEFYTTAMKINDLASFYNNDLDDDEKRELLEGCFENNNTILITLISDLGNLCRL